MLLYIIAGSVVLTLGVSMAIYLVMRGVQQAAPKAREPDWFRRVRESKFGFLLPAILVPLAYLGIVVLSAGLISGGSIFVRIIDNLPMAGVFAFFPFMNRAKVPVGGLLCTKCRYNVESLAPPIPEGQSKPPVHDVVCPECGSQFGWPGGTISEHHEWRPARLILPSLLLLPFVIKFASIPFGGVLWWNDAVNRIVPTDSLIKDVTTSRSFTMSAWSELSGRGLTAEQNLAIASSLLSPPQRTHFTIDQEKWLSTALAAKAIPVELVEPWLSRLIMVNQLPSIQDPRVQVKFDTQVLQPFKGLHVTLVVESDAADQARNPVTVPLTGTPAFSSYFLGPVSFSATTAHILAVLHAPGEVVATPDAGIAAEKQANALYFVRVPIDVRFMRQPVKPGDSGAESPSPASGVPRPNPQPGLQPNR